MTESTLEVAPPINQPADPLNTPERNRHTNTMPPGDTQVGDVLRLGNRDSGAHQAFW